MEGDGFSDPRRRAARRPRGASRGRGRGQPNPRAPQKRQTSTKPRHAPNLGSNEYRFRDREEDEEENAYDAGADFEEVASRPMHNPISSEDMQSSVNLSEEMVADFSKLESVLASVPLWIRLGEHSKFALGVPEEDKIENYLDPLPSESAETEEFKEQSNNNPDTEFLRDLADLSFDDDHVTSEETLARQEVIITSNRQEENRKEGQSHSGAQTEKQPMSSSPTEEDDDFEKWLDEI